MTKAEVISLLEDLMESDEGVLTEDTVLTDLEEWDSLTKLSLMAEVKKKDNKKLTADDIKAFITIKDILNFIGQ